MTTIQPETEKANDAEKQLKPTHDLEKEYGIADSDGASSRHELFATNDDDEALSAKMTLVNSAIDEIGFTKYQLKLFFLNGFGYAVDSLLLLLSSIVQPYIAQQYNPSFSKGQTFALYVGMLTGAMFWGPSADIIGRRWAFNISLLVCSIFAIAAGGAPNYIGVCALVALMAFGGGGNLVLDTAVYLEFLPSKYQWTLTFMAAWWGVGQTIAGLIAWPLLTDYSCPDSGPCNDFNNKGWRYTFYAEGGLVFLMSMLRIFAIRLKESPKWLLSQNRDEEVVQIIQEIASEAGRPCSLTIEQLRACGETRMVSVADKYKAKNLFKHFTGLFPNRKVGLSTALNFASWALIGLAYPIFNVFLPYYLKSRGAQFGETSSFINNRNYAIANFCGIWGPLVAGGMVEIRRLGRRGTMAIGAVLTMIFLFAYTAIKNQAENFAFTCVISFVLNIYYGT